MLFQHEFLQQAIRRDHALDLMPRTGLRGRRPRRVVTLAEDARVTRRIALRWTALTLALAALGLAGWYLLTAPTTIRVAAGPPGSQQIRFLQSMARAMADGRESFRLEIVPVASSAAGAAALDAGKIDLALLRSDDPTSLEGRAVVLIQKRHVFVVARKDRMIADWGDLRGKRVGLVRGDSDDARPLIERILNQYGVGPSDVQLQDTDIDTASATLGTADVDALVFVGFPGQRARRVVSETTDWRKTPIHVFGVPAAGALAFRYRDIEQTELPAGVFSGSPPQPAQPIQTVAITHELVANAAMSDSRATDLTRAILDSSNRIRRTEDNAFHVEAPPVDRPRRYPPHPGTAAYVNDEAMGFLETYSEYIWLTLFALSIIGSSITGFLGWAGLREEPETISFAEKMARLMVRLDAARSEAEIALVEAEFDALLKGLVRDYGTWSRDESAEDPSPIISLFSRFLEKRRAELAGAEATT